MEFNKLYHLIIESEYDKPCDLEYLKKNYPKLLKDSAHYWRAKTGIELIHKEPTIEEFERIVTNWNNMNDEMKKKSDEKSIQLFGKENSSRISEIRKSYSAGLSGMPLIEARQTIMELLNDVNVNGGRYGDIAFHPEILGQ